MIKHRWVVVADSAHGRVMEYTDDGLQLVQSFRHAASQEAGQDLIGNRPNQNQHSMERDLKGENPHAQHDEESVRFAKELANFLSVSHAQNRFGDLVLVADPKFLGRLRSELGRPVAACVSGSVNRHAVHLQPREVAELVGAAQQSH